MTQKTTPDGAIFFCEFCGRDNFKSRQAAAAHEKVCGKNPAVCPQPAPAKVEQPEPTPAKDEQIAAPADPLPEPAPIASDSKADTKSSPIVSSGREKPSQTPLDGDNPALPYGLIVMIFIIVGAGIALYAFRDGIVSFWEQLVNGDDEHGKPPQPATV